LYLVARSATTSKPKMRAGVVDLVLSLGVGVGAGAYAVELYCRTLRAHTARCGPFRER